MGDQWYCLEIIVCYCLCTAELGYSVMRDRAVLARPVRLTWPIPEFEILCSAFPR